MLRQAPTIGDSLCDACREHFGEVRRFLDAYGIRYELVPTLVRGLDYYTRTTWEFVGPEGTSTSVICGGGRYDGLAEELGGDPTPAIGFGAGIERLLLALEHAGVSAPEPEGIDVFFLCEPDADRAAALRLMMELRRDGVRCDTDYARPFAQGPADAGKAPRGEADRHGRGAGTDIDALLEELAAVTWRDLMCGDVRPEHIGRRIALAGWANTRRDHGGLVFIDLRDRAGICQLVVNPEHAPEAAAAAHEVRNEFVLRAEGEVVARAPEAVNPNLPTGDVEVQVERLEIVSRSTPLPFQLDEENVDETLRLRYRWLDLRRDKLQRNIGLRAQMVGIIRRTMEEAGFLDIQTPILFKPTPEGARDFVVPSRLQKGRFFALPQSPQILKQLTMVAGFDRYYQIAICFRDEDLRADRVQEITQLDVEMSFPDQEFLFELMEEMFGRIWRDCLGIEVPRPWPRMTFAEADRRFGTDKPDTRFGLEIEDATEATRGSEFGVFGGAEAVRFLRVPRAFSRAELARLEEVAKEWGAKGLAYIVGAEDGELRSPIVKFLSEAELGALAVQPGETLLFAADAWAATSRVLSALRLQLGRELGLSTSRRSRSSGSRTSRCSSGTRTSSASAPCTTRSRGRPTSGRSGSPTTRGHALAHAYDIIVNGNELGGGSFRIHEPEIQARVFDLLRLSPEEQRTKFGFLLDALAMGAPPHGGIALGIDRMTMVLAGEPNLRDVIAFPKNQAGVDPMSGAPSEVTPEQLAELGLRIVAPSARRRANLCDHGRVHAPVRVRDRLPRPARDRVRAGRPAAARDRARDGRRLAPDDRDRVARVALGDDGRRAAGLAARGHGRSPRQLGHGRDPRPASRGRRAAARPPCFRPGSDRRRAPEHR